MRPATWNHRRSASIRRPRAGTVDVPRLTKWLHVALLLALPLLTWVGFQQLSTPAWCQLLLQRPSFPSAPWTISVSSRRDPDPLARPATSRRRRTRRTAASTRSGSKSADDRGCAARRGRGGGLRWRHRPQHRRSTAGNRQQRGNCVERPLRQRRHRPGSDG